MRQFESWFQDKCQILIIGPDTIRLSDRIFNADEYYKGNAQVKPSWRCGFLRYPPIFEKSAKEVQCLRHCSHASSLFSIQERAEALIAGQELLENNLIRQISYTDAEPSKVPGDTTTHRYLHTTHLIGLEFAGMEFGIEWNIKDPTSKDHCWKASHGIPYIEAASPRDTKVAVKDRRRHQKPQSLVFYPVYPDWDPQSTVSIPISSS
ncbi:hypothetical protein N7524_011635 [Penicillium chrysogenum]|nr:hypothetical protein N7524_011635 [Penicillium chrysogenum]